MFKVTVVKTAKKNYYFNKSYYHISYYISLFD